MPRAGWRKPESDERLSDHVSLGVLTRTYPPWLVDEVIALTGKTEQRNRMLPARVLVYYVMAMTLFADASYEEVMRHLVEGFSWLSGWREQLRVPTKSAIFQGRDRLGAEPLRALFEAVARPLATVGDHSGAYYRTWRVMALDGSRIDLADTEANAREFGRPGNSRGERSAFPQLQLVGLAECGTHALVKASIGALGIGERELALPQLQALEAGSLCLADRGLYSYEFWREAAGTRADLLWRARNDLRLEVEQGLEDGSFLSTVGHSLKPQEPRLPVRVIPYAIDDPGRRPTQDAYRLLTTILNPKAAPAAELAALYAKRWSFETTLDELKTHQRGARMVLRSKLPEGVRQELYGYLLTHFAIRSLMYEIAEEAGVAVERLSFLGALRGARRSTTGGAFSPSGT